MPTPASIGQRFTQLIQHLGLSKNAFAQSLDKTATVIQHLVDERNKPGYDLLCKVFETYPNVSKDWLLMGHGPMLVAEATEPAVAASAAPSAEDEAIEWPPMPVPRRRATGDGPRLQPNEVAAAVALAAQATNHAATPAPAPFSAEKAAAPSSAAAPAAPATPVVPPIPTPVSVPDPAYLTAALQTQYLQHQLALAEQRNQHLLAQQALMQQLVAVLQRTTD